MSGRGTDGWPGNESAAIERGVREGGVMGKEARVALLLAGSACLTAVMVEWVISELKSEDHHEHQH